MRIPWRYPALVIAATWSFALFWPRLSAHSTLRRWLGDRPSLRVFQSARPIHYAKLSAIRAAIFAAQGIVLYVELLSFNVYAPLTNVFALEAMILLLGALPIAPVGLGVRQALTVEMLEAFGSKANLLAASLAHSAVTIMLRAVLGLIFAGEFARMLAEPAATGDEGGGHAHREETKIAHALTPTGQGLLAKSSGLRSVGINPHFWYPLARSSSLKREQAVGVSFVGKLIVLVRTRSGAIFALEDRCGDRQVPLHLGRISGESLICACHGWRYDSSGNIEE